MKAGSCFLYLIKTSYLPTGGIAAGVGIGGIEPILNMSPVPCGQFAQFPVDTGTNPVDPGAFV